MYFVGGLLPLFIANGVTGVRQMWGMPMHFNWRESTKSDALVAPRFAIASTIVDGPNPVWPGSIVVRDDKKASALFSAFVRNGTWHCPTLVVLRSMASLDDPAFTSDPRLKYMPPSIRQSWVPKNDFRLSTKGPEDYAVDRRVVRKLMEVVSAMRRAGVKLIAGTDVLNPFAFPGFSLHDELALPANGVIRALNGVILRPYYPNY